VTASALPPEVERAQEAYAKTFGQILVRRICESEPSGEVIDAQDRLKGTDAETYLVIKPSDLAEWVQRHVSDAFHDGEIAIARALDGDGEPVAWGVMGSNGKCYEPFLSGADAAAKAEMATMAGYGGAPFTVAPLFTRPTATGDTGEGGGGA